MVKLHNSIKYETSLIVKDINKGRLSEMNKLYLKLARINLSNNKPLYIPYILSSIVTVAMLYIMSFLSNNKGLKKIPGSESLSAIFGLGVGVIVIFSYIFLFYTNSFIIKRRKKEIGVYNILGMEKRHLSKVLLIETFCVAGISIVCGIIAGIAFSKFMLMLLYGIMGVSETVEFFVSVNGIILCTVSFGILYVVILLYNLMQIKLANPIELLRGGNVGEREPKTKIIMTIIGVACMGVAYYIAITTENPLKVLSLFFVAVILVVIGTYALFTAGSIALLKALRNNKKFYYNKKNFMAVSGMLYRMKQNAAGLASICILSTMVLVVVSTTVSMYVGIQDELEARYPSDICVVANYDKAQNKCSELSEITLNEVKNENREIKNLKTYSYLPVLLKLEGNSKFIRSKNNMSYQDSYFLNIISKDDFIQMDSSFKNKINGISKGEAVVILNREYSEKEITILDNTYKVNQSFEHTEDKDLYLVSMMKGAGYIVLDTNESVQELYGIITKEFGKAANSYKNEVWFDLKSGSKAERIELFKKLNNTLQKYQKQNKKECLNIYVESRQESEDNFYLMYGGFLFLGIFLGTMFLMVTVMIIFYKQITEGFDDRSRYQILEKVGMSSKEVKATIKSQIRIVFVLPIFAAAVHMAAAFPMINRLLKLLNLNNDKLFAMCLIASIIVFAIIYYLVFKLTSRAYYKIVK